MNSLMLFLYRFRHIPMKTLLETSELDFPVLILKQYEIYVHMNHPAKRDLY